MKYLVQSSVLFLSLGLPACGASPLLHHKNAAPVAVDAPDRGENAAPAGGEAQNGEGNTAPTAGDGQYDGQPTARPPFTESLNCALRFRRTQLCASLIWETKPKAEAEEGVFAMQFYTSQGLQEMNMPHSVSVQLWMPSMGHGSAPVTVTPLGLGGYRASRVFFIMPGDWEIRVQLKDGNNLVDQAVQSIHI